MTALAAPPTPPVPVPDYPPEAGYFDNFGHFHPGPTTTVLGAPRPDADPGSLRVAAGQVAMVRDAVAHHHAELTRAIGDLLEGRGQWYGTAATAFRTDVWDPLDRTLGDVRGKLDDLAGKLHDAASQIEQAYDDRQKAIEAAIVALVACGVLSIFTFGASDAVAEAAAVGAAAECTRVVELVASVGRVIAAEARAAFDGLDDLFRAFADLAALRNYPAAFNLATKLGQLQAIPALAGAGSGVLFTVGVGDTNPLDVATAAVTGTVDAVGGSAGEEEALPEFYQRSDGSVEEERGGVVTVVPPTAPRLEPLGDDVIIRGEPYGRITTTWPAVVAHPGSIENASLFQPKERDFASYLADRGRDVIAVPVSPLANVRTHDAFVDAQPTEFKRPDANDDANICGLLQSASGQFADAAPGSIPTVYIDGRYAGVDQATARRGIVRFLGSPKSGVIKRIVVVGNGWETTWTE